MLLSEKCETIKMKSLCSPTFKDEHVNFEYTVYYRTKYLRVLFNTLCVIIQGGRIF